MNRRAVCFVAVLLFLAAFQASANQVTVGFSDFKFTPKTVTINVGDTVNWVNQGGSHDVQSNTTLFKSPAPPVQNFSFTFTTAGTVNYHCNPHQSRGMVGSVVVQAAAANVPPAVSLTSPANGGTFAAPATIQLTAQASDSDGSVAKVDFVSGRTVVGTATSAPYQVTLQNVAAGTYTFTASATDNLGATTVSAPVTVTVTAPNAPPAAALISPQDGGLLAAPVGIPLEATASDPEGQLSRVDFYRIQNIGGPSVSRTLLGSASSAPYRFTITNAAPGFYHLLAEAVDDQGNKGDSAVASVTVYSPYRTESVTRGGNGAVTLLFSGDFSMGQAAVQVSNDLKSWLDLPATGFSRDAGGRTIFTDASAGTSGVRFYRLHFQFLEPAPVP